MHMQSEESNSEVVRLEAEDDEEEEEEEYVMLDLDEVFHGAPIPANYPFTLSVTMFASSQSLSLNFGRFCCSCWDPLLAVEQLL